MSECCAFCPLGADVSRANVLTDKEKSDGWQLAWDGKTFDGWVAAKGGFAAPPEKGWVIEGGTLSMRPVNGISADGKWFPLPPEKQKLGGGGDIVTVKKYRDFMFKFDFRLTSKGNSGVKYFCDEKQNGGTCEEYQILDEGHPDWSKGKDGNRRVASLYDIFPAHAESLAKPVGEWNQGMIVANGSRVEHWLNGKKVLEYDRTSKAFKDGVMASKYAAWGKSANGKPQPWGELSEGRILLQDHADSIVYFCNLKIKELNAEHCPVSENVRGHENVEWSRAYAYGLTDATKDLPRVLLVGDSICNGYQERVRELLKGKMNVSYWISSYCVTSPAYLPLLSVYLDEAKYDVIHFNNGLHSLGTPTAAYKNGVRTAIELIRRRQPQAKTVWCSSTPLKDAEKTAKCRELNAAAAQVVAELGGIATNDLFALLDPLDREENWSDVYHHKPPLRAKEAEHVAESVLSALWGKISKKE